MTRRGEVDREPAAKTRLLRGAWRRAQRRRGRAQAGISRAGPQVPPGHQPGAPTTPRIASKRSTRPTRSCPIPSTRARYDRFGHSAVSGQEAQEGGGFGSVVEAVDDILGDIIGDAWRRRRQRKRGRDLRYTLEVSFEEAVFGCTKTIAVPRKGRSGSVSSADKPAGKSAKANFAVSIPPGTKEGAVKMIKGEGEPGYRRSASRRLARDRAHQGSPAFSSRGPRRLVRGAHRISPGRPGMRHRGADRRCQGSHANSRGYPVGPGVSPARQGDPQERHQERSARRSAGQDRGRDPHRPDPAAARATPGAGR